MGLYSLETLQKTTQLLINTYLILQKFPNIKLKLLCHASQYILASITSQTRNDIQEHYDNTYATIASPSWAFAFIGTWLKTISVACKIHTTSKLHQILLADYYVIFQVNNSVSRAGAYNASDNALRLKSGLATRDCAERIVWFMRLWTS